MKQVLLVDDGSEARLHSWVPNKLAKMGKLLQIHGDSRVWRVAAVWAIDLRADQIYKEWKVGGLT